MDVHRNHNGLTAVRLLAFGLLISACAGCASASAGAANSAVALSSSSAIPSALAQLIVRAGLYGGPIKLDGTMAEVDAPAQGIKVTLSGAGSVTFGRTTGPDGTAVFPVAPGRWTVTSDCGNPQTLDVQRSAVVAVQCDIP